MYQFSLNTTRLCIISATFKLCTMRFDDFHYICTGALDMHKFFFEHHWVMFYMRNL